VSLTITCDLGDLLRLEGAFEPIDAGAPEVTSVEVAVRLSSADESVELADPSLNEGGVPARLVKRGVDEDATWWSVLWAPPEAGTWHIAVRGLVDGDDGATVQGRVTVRPLAA
jgi:hypothetical protein